MRRKLLFAKQRFFEPTPVRVFFLSIKHHHSHYSYYSYQLYYYLLDGYIYNQNLDQGYLGLRTMNLD